MNGILWPHISSITCLYYGTRYGSISLWRWIAIHPLHRLTLQLSKWRLSWVGIIFVLLINNVTIIMPSPTFPQRWSWWPCQTIWRLFLTQVWLVLLKGSMSSSDSPYLKVMLLITFIVFFFLKLSEIQITWLKIHFFFALNLVEISI